MVAQNPLWSGSWGVKRFNATVINDIWPEVVFFTLVATSELLLVYTARPPTDDV